MSYLIENGKYVMDGGKLAIEVAPAIPIYAPVMGLWQDMMMMYEIYFSPDSTGGSGEYEYALGEGDWYDKYHWTAPFNSPGSYSFKCRDKNNITNIVNCDPYPLVLS